MIANRVNSRLEVVSSVRAFTIQSVEDVKIRPGDE